MIKVVLLVVFLSIVAGDRRVTNFDNYGPYLYTYEKGTNVENEALQNERVSNDIVFRKRPCFNSRRQSFKTSTEDQWIPTYHWKHVQPIARPDMRVVNNLQSQSLHNIDSNNAYPRIDDHKKYLGCITRTNNSNQDSETIREDIDTSQKEKFLSTLVSQTTEGQIKVDNAKEDENEHVNEKYSISSITSSRRFLSVNPTTTAHIFNSVRKNKQENVEMEKNNLSIARTKFNINSNDKQANENNNPEDVKMINEEIQNKSENDEMLSDEESGARRRISTHLENWLLEPTRGIGISRLGDSHMLLMENSRVCFACSSTNDPTCSNPNRRTTVKYCRKDHNVCVTKTYKSMRSHLIVIRDCSNSCDVSMPILDTRYESCSICKSDLCNNIYIENGAFSSYTQNLLCIMLVTFVMRLIF